MADEQPPNQIACRHFSYIGEYCQECDKEGERYMRVLKWSIPVDDDSHYIGGGHVQAQHLEEN